MRRATTSPGPPQRAWEDYHRPCPGAGNAGEYAAVTAWFGVTLMIGGMGQPAALCFCHVAHDPGNACLCRDIAGADADDRHSRAGQGHPPGSAPHPGNAGLTVAYRIAFAGPSPRFSSSAGPASAAGLSAWRPAGVMPGSSDPSLGTARPNNFAESGPIPHPEHVPALDGFNTIMPKTPATTTVDWLLHQAT